MEAKNAEIFGAPVISWGRDWSIDRRRKQVSENIYRIGAGVVPLGSIASAVVCIKVTMCIAHRYLTVQYLTPLLLHINIIDDDP